jgi:pilus assembly protein Flp/PilA
MLAFHALLNWLKAHDDDASDRGASLIEYALLIALIATVCVAALTALGGTTSDSFSEVTSLLG